MTETLTPEADSSWFLSEIGYDPLRESSRESRFSISNGFLGIRATRAINREAHFLVPPVTYVAGLFDTRRDEQTAPGLIPGPDWLQVLILRDNQPVLHQQGDGSTHRRSLDFKHGVLHTECHFVAAPGIICGLQSQQLVSLSQRSIGLQLIRLEMAEDGATVRLDAAFSDVDKELICEFQDRELAVWRTASSGKRLTVALTSTLCIDSVPMLPSTPTSLARSWTWVSRPGQVVSFLRMVAFTLHDAAEPVMGNAARTALSSARQSGWQGVLAAHSAMWGNRWRSSDVEVGGDPAAQRALRFAIYHLNSAADPDNEHVSIGARALTGNDYRGHVFWDTEIFLLPFYSLTWRQAARALLMYRFHTLNEARAKAARMGWRGALYAWESADAGAEATPEQVIGPDRKVVDIHCGQLEQHISAVCLSG